MTPDEQELRRALDARSGPPSPEFRARLSSRLAGGRPAASLAAPMAMVAVIVLAALTIGILMLARYGAGQRSIPGPASGPRVVSPTPPTHSPVAGVLTTPPEPIPLPGTAQLSAPSSNVVWALINGQYLYRSTDTGRSWRQMPLPPSTGGFPLPEISFVSDREGWLSTGGSPATQCQEQMTVVWHTADSGATWQDMGSKGIARAQCKEGLSFVDTRHGFLDAWDQNHAPVIYATKDGGQTWAASRPLPDPSGFKSGPGGFTLQASLVRAFGATLLVPAWGQSLNGNTSTYVFRSTDGGATWTYLATAGGGTSAVIFVTATRWLNLIVPDQSRETTDAGKSWHLYPSDYSQAAPIAPEVVFVDAAVGYATVRGSIQLTTDGGLHWTYLRTPGT